MDYLRKFPSYSKDSNFHLYNGNLEDSKFDYFKQKFPTHYEIESSLKSSQDAFVSWNNNFNIHSFHYPNYNRLYSQPRIADVSSQIMRPLVSTFPPASVFQENPHSFAGNSIFHHVFPTHQQQQQGHQLQFNYSSQENQQKMAFHTMKRPRSEKKPVPELMKDEKYKEKRAKNNKAAKKSRQERREKEDKNEKELKFLREELRRLVEEEWSLKVQNHELKTKIAAMSKQLCLDGDLNDSTSAIS